jgi:hypothetical protein
MNVTMMVSWNGRDFEGRVEDIEGEMPLILGRFKTMDEAIEQARIALTKAIEKREMAWLSPTQ